MQPSLFDHRVKVAWVLRTGGHLALALGGPGSIRVRAAKAGGWLAWDRVVRDWHATSSQPKVAARSILDVLEVLVLTRRPPAELDAARRVQACNVVVPAMEAGYRLGAGTEAVPVVDPSRPFPPRGRQLVEVVAEGMASVAAPHLVARWRFGRRGLRMHPFEGIWALGMLGGQFGLARYRDRLHADARRAWWERAQHQVQLEQRGAAAQAAIANTPAHDVKKHLTLLGVSGSELARRAASEQSDHPRTVLAQSSGTTLLRAALGIPVEPSHLASTWISEDQRQVLDELIDGIDAELEDRGPQPSIEVLEIEGTRIHLLYRGRRIDLANPAPTLEAALDPVSLSLLVGAGWKLLNALDPGVRLPLRYVLPGVAVDLGFAATCERARRRGDPGRFTVAVIGSLVSSTVSDLGIWRAGPPGPGPRADAIPATGSALGALAMIGICEGRVPGWLARAGALGILAKWGAMAGVVGRRNRRELALELISLWQGWAAPRGLAASTAAESQVLESTLQRGFQEAVRTARRSAYVAEVDRAERQVDLVDAELARLREDLDPELADLVEGQCRELRTWIREQREALASAS